MSTLLALDQASKVTGYSIYKNNTFYKHGRIVANSTDIGERLKHLRDSLIHIIEQYEVDEVIFEDIQLQDNVGNNVATFKVLAEVIGVVAELLTELKIPYSAVLAGTWRKELGIAGNQRPVQKKNAQKYVKQRYSIDVSEDEADAICIGCYKTNKKTQTNSFDWSD